MVTRSKIALLSLGILSGTLHAEGLQLERPSHERISFEVRREQRSIALRKTVRYGIYTAGTVTLASILLREHVAKLLPDVVDTVTSKEQSLGYLQSLSNSLKSGAGRVKRFIMPQPAQTKESLLEQLTNNPHLRERFADFIVDEVKKDQGVTGTIKHYLWQGTQVSLVVAILSWIEQRPLTLLRIYLDRLWSLWHSNLRKTLMQLSDTASNLEIMRTFVEALGQGHINVRDRKFYCSQLHNSHTAFVRSIERLCAMMSIDVHDQDTLDWLGDFNNGFWETFFRFTSLLEEDLQPSAVGDEIVISLGTRNELEQVRVALQQFVATYRAKNI